VWVSFASAREDQEPKRARRSTEGEGLSFKPYLCVPCPRWLFVGKLIYNRPGGLLSNADPPIAWKPLFEFGQLLPMSEQNGLFFTAELLG
jgi:hypothetical protein